MFNKRFKFKILYTTLWGFHFVCCCCLYKIINLHKYNYQYARICANMREYVRICANMREIARCSLFVLVFFEIVLVDAEKNTTEPG